MTNSTLAKALQDSMPKGKRGVVAPDAVLRGYLIAGQRVMDENPAVNTSIHPAWRTSYALIVGTDLSSIRSLAPESGAYLNEVWPCGSVVPDKDSLGK